MANKIQETVQQMREASGQNTAKPAVSGGSAAPGNAGLTSLANRFGMQSTSTSSKIDTQLGRAVYKQNPQLDPNYRSTRYSGMVDYLNSGNTDYDTTKSYLDEANGYAKSAETDEERDYWTRMANGLLQVSYADNNKRKSATQAKIDDLDAQIETLRNNSKAAPLPGSTPAGNMVVTTPYGAMNINVPTKDSDEITELVRQRDDLVKELESYGDNTSPEVEEAIGRLKGPRRNYTKLAKQKIETNKTRLAEIETELAGNITAEKRTQLEEEQNRLKNENVTLAYNPDSLREADQELVDNFNLRWNSGARNYTVMDDVQDAVNAITLGVGSSLLNIAGTAAEGMAIDSEFSMAALAGKLAAEDGVTLDENNLDEYMGKARTMYEEERAERGMLERKRNTLNTMADTAEAMGLTDLAEEYRSNADAIVTGPIEINGVREQKTKLTDIANWMQGASDTLKASADEHTAKAQAGKGEVGQFVIDLGINAGQMAFDHAIGILTGTEGASLAMMAARVFGESAGEARREGATHSQQVGYGVANAGIEYVTEKMFGVFDHFGYGKGFTGGWVEKGIAGLARTPAGRSTLRVLAQLGGEGMEEVASDLLHPFAEMIYKDGTWAELSEDERAHLFQSFLSGAALALFSSAGGVVSGQNSAATAQSYIDEVSMLAPELAAKQAAGTPLTARDTRNMNRVQNATDRITAMAGTFSGAGSYLNARLTGADTAGTDVFSGVTPEALAGAGPAVRKGARALLNSEDAREGLEDILTDVSDIVLGTETGEPLDWSPEMSDSAVGYVTYVLTNGLAGGRAYDAASRAALAQEAVEFAQSGLTIEQAAQAAMENTRDSVVIKPGPETAEAEAPAPVQAQAEEDAGTMERVDQIVAEEEEKQKAAPRQQDVVDILTEGAVSNKQADRIGKDPAMMKAFREATGIDLSGMTSSEKRAAIRDAAAARARAASETALDDIINEVKGYEASETDTAEILAETARGESQSRGQADTLRESENAKSESLTAKNGKQTDIPQGAKAESLKRGDGKVSYDGATVEGETYAAVDTSKLTDRQKAQIRAMGAVAEATGVNVVFYQSGQNEKGQFVGANGFYLDGTVYLDINAGLESMTEDGRTVGEVAMVRTAAHELTHFIRDTSEKDYQALQDFAVKTLTDRVGAEGLESLIREKQERAGGEDRLSREDALEEVVADGCEMMLRDSKAIKRLAVQNKSLAKRIRDWIRNFVDSIREAFDGIGEAHTEARILMREAEKLQKLWDDALANAVRNNAGTESANQGTKWSEREVSFISSSGVMFNDNTPDGNITVGASPVISALHPRNGSSLIKYQARTEREALPKQIFTFKGDSRMLVDETGKNANLSVRDIRDAVALANGISAENIAKVNKFLDRVEKEMKGYELKYRFVGLKDIENATILMDRSGNIILSAMVKNDEYAVNFDFTKLCKKRQALQQVIETLAREKGRASENGTTEVDLSAENVQRINEMLAAAGVETNCLGCFVEAKRANQQQLNSYILNDWNAIVDEVAPGAGYFHFADAEGEANLHDSAEDKAAFDAYREALNKLTAERKQEGKGVTPTMKARLLIENVPAARKKLTYSDLATERGRTRLHQEFPEIDSFAKARLGTASFKTVEAFTPYNAEVELLGQKAVKVENGKLVVKKDDGSLRKELAKIGGARSQSFSDFIISHVYDVMQKTAAFAARGLPAHTYTKEISRATLFGKTGEKHNLSVLFEVDPSVDSWSAGLTKNGNYFVGDYQHFRMQEGEEGKAHFIQSIGFEDARKLQNTDGYSKNCGIIAVPLSYRAYKKALADPDIRMIIGYHSSGMPVEVKSKTHYDMAADYQGVQNTQKVVRLVKPNYEIPEGIPSYATPPSDVKPISGGSKTVKSDMTFDIKGRFEELSAGKTGDARTAAAKQTLQEFLDFMNENGLTAVTTKTEAGYGKFPLYEDVQQTRDPYLTADHYIEYCIEKGELPLFWEFATDQNYYKQLYDFNMFDRLTYNSETGRHEDMPGREAYAPQEAVHLLDSNGKFLLPEDFFDLVDKYTKDYNYQMQAVSEAVPKVLEAVKKESGKAKKSEREYTRPGRQTQERMDEAERLTEDLITFFEDNRQYMGSELTAEDIRELTEQNLFNGAQRGDMTDADEIMQELSDYAGETGDVEAYELMERILPHLDTQTQQLWTNREGGNRNEAFAEWYNGKHPSLYYPGYQPGDLFRPPVARNSAGVPFDEWAERDRQGLRNIRKEREYLRDLIESGNLVEPELSQAQDLLDRLENNVGRETFYQLRENGAWTPPVRENTQAPETETAPEQAPAQAPQGNPFFPNEPVPAPKAPGVTREKVSQFFSNTLRESGRDEGLDPVTYNPTSEAESLARAAMRMSGDRQELLGELMQAKTWTNEMVDAAWMIENEFYKEYVRTGDSSNWDNWRRIETQKISETAKGLQAVAKQSRPGAAGVLNAAMAEIDSVREENAKAEKAGRKAGNVKEEVLTAAESKIRDAAYRMAQLEAEVDDAVAEGMSEEEAEEAVKDRYLDLISDINLFRNVGLFQDTALRSKAERTGRKFRKMLAKQDMAYIKRYAACAAAGIAEDVHYSGKQDIRKRLNTWQKLAQLTGTGTWLRNGVGNGSFGIVDVLSADNPLTILTDAILSKKTGMRSSGVEFGILNGKARQAAHQALERSILEVAGNIDLATDRDSTKYDMARTRTFDPDGSTAERLMSRWEQWNGYMLQSSDAWFKGAAEGSVRDALIRANGWDAENLTAEQEKAISETARQVAEYRTFQNDGAAARAANELRDLLNRGGARAVGREWQQGQFGLGTAIMPYTKVPTNLGVKSLEFSPLGMAKGLAEIARVAGDKNATMAQQNKAVTDFGRGVTGTMAIWLLAKLMRVLPWFRDWENEDDKDVIAQNRAEGKYGIQMNLSMLKRFADGDRSGEWRTGDRTIDISSMEPVNQLLTTASLIADGMPAWKAIGKSSLDNLKNIPSVSTLANIEDTIRYSTAETAGEKALEALASTAGSVAGGMIPAPLRHIASVTDEYARDTSGNNAWERALNQAKSSIPGLRQTLPEKVDAFGNKVSAGDLRSRIGNAYDAFKHTQVNQTAESAEVAALMAATGEKLLPSRNAPGSVTYGSGSAQEKVQLTADEKREYKIERGQTYEEAVRQMMDSPIYRQADDDTKAEMLKTLLSYATDEAKTGLADERGISYDGQYDDVRQLQDPFGYLTLKTGYSTWDASGNWTNVDRLIREAQQMDAGTRAYAMEHVDGFGSLYDIMQEGLSGSEAWNRFRTGSKARAEARGSSAANGADILAEVVNGRYSNSDADILMGRQKADGSYHAGKGRHAVYQAMRENNFTPQQAAEFWAAVDVNGNGTVTKKEFNAALKLLNADYRQAVSDAFWRIYDGE